MRKEENRIDPNVTKKLRLMVSIIGWLPLVLTIIKLFMTYQSSLDERGEITIGTIGLGIVSYFVIIPLAYFFVLFSRKLSCDIEKYEIPRWSPSMMIIQGIVIGCALDFMYETKLIGIFVSAIMIGMGIWYCFINNKFKIICCWVIALLVTVFALASLVTLKHDLVFVLISMLVTCGASYFPLKESYEVQKIIEKSEAQVKESYEETSIIEN